MRTKLLIIAFAASLLFIPQSQAQTSASGFPKGELSNAKNHTGTIWLSELNVGDSTFDPSIGEPFLSPFPCCFAHTVQPLGHAFPALCRGHVD
jgi:hypothetical protein